MQDKLTVKLLPKPADISLSTETTAAEMFPTHVHPWKGTFHGKETGGPGLSRSHPPSSAEQTARSETNRDKRRFKSTFTTLFVLKIQKLLIWFYVWGSKVVHVLNCAKLALHLALRLTTISIYVMFSQQKFWKNIIRITKMLITRSHSSNILLRQFKTQRFFIHY